MTSTECPECHKPISMFDRNCLACGADVTAKLDSDQDETGEGERSPSRQLLLAALGVTALVAVLLGNVHIVSGADGRWFVPRISFGYEDAFGSVSDCTSVPWILALAKHGKLCMALQEAGILESDTDRADRIRSEIEREMRRTQQEIERETREMMRRLNR